MASTDARPVPIKNTAYRVTFPILDADGDLVTGATGLDSECSKDGATFADCTNEATEIATSSGMYYLDLTSTEMNADCVAVIVKTTSSGAKTTPIVLYPQESGDIKVDVQSYGGTAGTFSGGRPEVNTTHAAGTAWGSGAITAASIASSAIADTKIATGAITAAKFAASAIDATAIASSAITSAKFAAGAIDAAAIADNAIDLATFAADAKALMGVVAFGTAQSVTGTTIRLAAAETFADDELIGATVLIRSASTGAGQARVITDYVSSTDTATVDTWTTTPTGTITYVVFATSPASASAPIAANVTQWAGAAVATPSVAGVPEVDLTHVAGATTNVAALATNVDAILTDTAEIGAAGAGLTALASAANLATVAGYIDTEVAAIKAKTDNLPAAPAAVGDIPTAAAVADAVWDEAIAGHVGAGSTGAALNTASSAAGLDAAGVRAAVGLASANLDTQLGTLATASALATVDTVVDSIKAKTDSLTFTKAGEVDANIQSINDVTINGAGVLGNEFGP